MNLKLTTEVDGNYKEVMASFDRDLCEALKPPFGEMQIVEFTGSKKGDKVHLRFIKPFKAEWVSDITEDGINETQAWFVDKGVKLPWPLKTWSHKHIVEKINENRCKIIDDITFTGPNFLFTLFLYPGLFIAFSPRKKIYKAYFKN